MVEYLSENVILPELDFPVVTSWLERVAQSHRKTLGELCYIFCDDPYILKVNNDYLEHDYYTDIITFDYCESDVLSGDLFISIDTVTSNALQFNSSYVEELHRVIVHGVLHLCGINDKSDEDALLMRNAEDSALLLLKSISDEF